jgi:glyoxylase-like metal-dependent hydrolase (beta-lactamase superfamily II)
MGRYPEAIVVCHPQAVHHLIDPVRLWHGSVKVLGDLARTYGEPSPVKSTALCPGCDIVWKGYRIESLETPGHASHHLCFFLEDMGVAGEVAGVRIPSGNPPHTRPATPPPFNPDVALSSLSRVMERGPGRICYGHYGMTDNAVSALTNARAQISLWLDLIRTSLGKGVDLDEQNILQEILIRDPGVQSFHQLEPDIQERETYFMKNSIKGMKGFLQGRSS